MHPREKKTEVNSHKRAVSTSKIKIECLDFAVSPRAHTKPPPLHLPLVLLQLRSFLGFLREQRGVLFLPQAPLLEAAKRQNAQRDHEGAEGAGDDADLGAAGEGLPAVADAGGGFNFGEDGGFAATIFTSALE
jgi:hypothetical protein